MYGTVNQCRFSPIIQRFSRNFVSSNISHSVTLFLRHFEFFPFHAMPTGHKGVTSIQGGGRSTRGILKLSVVGPKGLQARNNEMQQRISRISEGELHLTCTMGNTLKTLT